MGNSCLQVLSKALTSTRDMHLGKQRHQDRQSQTWGNSQGVQDKTHKAHGAPAQGQLEPKGSFTLPVLSHHKHSEVGCNKVAQFTSTFSLGHKFEHLWCDRRFGRLFAFTLHHRENFYGGTKVTSVSTFRAGNSYCLLKGLQFCSNFREVVYTKPWSLQVSPACRKGVYF